MIVGFEVLIKHFSNFERYGIVTCSYDVRFKFCELILLDLRYVIDVRHRKKVYEYAETADKESNNLAVCHLVFFYQTRHLEE